MKKEAIRFSKLELRKLEDDSLDSSGKLSTEREISDQYVYFRCAQFITNEYFIQSNTSLLSLSLT